MNRPNRRPHRIGRTATGLALLALATAACAAPDSTAPRAEDRSFADIRAGAEGQTVSLWMYGGDEQGNAYVDEILAPPLPSTASPCAGFL